MVFRGGVCKSVSKSHLCHDLQIYLILMNMKYITLRERIVKQIYVCRFYFLIIFVSFIFIFLFRSYGRFVHIFSFGYKKSSPSAVKESVNVVFLVVTLTCQTFTRKYQGSRTNGRKGPVIKEKIICLKPFFSDGQS